MPCLLVSFEEPPKLVTSHDEQGVQWTYSNPDHNRTTWITKSQYNNIPNLNVYITIDHSLHFGDWGGKNSFNLEKKKKKESNNNCTWIICCSVILSFTLVSWSSKMFSRNFLQTAEYRDMSPYSLPWRTESYHFLLLLTCSACTLSSKDLGKSYCMPYGTKELKLIVWFMPKHTFSIRWYKRKRLAYNLKTNLMIHHQRNHVRYIPDTVTIHLYLQVNSNFFICSLAELWKFP